MTGWTWAHVEEHVTLPQVRALSVYWRQQPPMVVLASRLCRYFGIEVSAKPDTPRATTVDDAVEQARAAGLPVMQGRPDDPMLDLLEL